MPATLKDIAKAVGKSITTVSRALNDYEDVSLETRLEIKKIAQEMGYFPNTFAQRLQKQRTDLLGVIMPVVGPRSTDLFLSEFLSGVGTAARSYGCDLLVTLNPPGQQELHSYRHMVQGRLVDGFLLTRTRQDDPRIKYLQQEGVPFVCYGRSGEKNDFPYIDIDGEQAMRLVIEYLLGLGHRRIACVASSRHYNFTSTRLKGFKEVLAENGIAIPKNYIVYGDLLQESGYRATSGLLDLPNRPTAIVAFNDMMAFGCLLAAQERGIKVPEDLSITGFDDLALSVTSNPPLTTVYQPIYEVGERLGTMLVNLIRGNEGREPVQQVLSTTLIIRNSCAPPRKRDSLLLPGPSKKPVTSQYDAIRHSLSPWVVDGSIDGFGVASQLERVESISFSCETDHILFPNNAGEWIEDIASLPSNYGYSLTYPGTASTKSMVIFFTPTEGVFIGAKPSTEFARISIRKVGTRRCEYTFQSKDNTLLFLPFQGSWKQVIPFFREYYKLPVIDHKPQSSTYMIQVGFRRPDGYSELDHFEQLIEPFRDFSRVHKRGHIIHFYATTKYGYLRNSPALDFEESQGGETGLRNTVKALQSLGYKVSCHFNPRLADYDWVQHNKTYRSAIIRDDRGQHVVNIIEGHPYYVMNPANARWYSLCKESIFYLKSFGFDFIQLSQFSNQPNFNLQSEVIHGAYRQLLREMSEGGIQYWLSGLSDLYSPSGASFSQFLRRPWQTMYGDGEPRILPPYGMAYPEFFMALYPDVKLAYPVLTNDENWKFFNQNFQRALELNTQVFDIQTNYYRKEFRQNIQLLLQLIRETSHPESL